MPFFASCIFSMNMVLYGCEHLPSESAEQVRLANGKNTILPGAQLLGGVLGFAVLWGS